MKSGEILLAESDPMVQGDLAKLLGDAGYALRFAASGETVLYSATLSPPDLIVLDARLPGMNSFEACRCLKRQAETAAIPVIFVAASPDPGERIQGIEAGAIDFISKPIKPDETLARVKTHLGMALTAKALVERRKAADECEAGRGQAEPLSGDKDILVVEDSLESLQLLSELLGGAGHVVRAAPNGELALWSACRRPPSLILLDIRMPGMNGFDVCRCLKANPVTSDIPVIFISAYSDSAYKQEGFEAGAVDFITKPFSEKELLARVRNHLQLAGVRPPPPARTPEDGSIRHSQQRIADAFSASATAIMFVDPAGRISYANPALARLSGFSPADLVGLDVRQLLADKSSQPIPGVAADAWSDEVILVSARGGGLACRLSYSSIEAGDGIGAQSIIALSQCSGQGVNATSASLYAAPVFPEETTSPEGLVWQLRGAVARNEMVVYYQPVFDLVTRRMAGAEALLRWAHPKLGLLAPATFLGLAEETGEIIALGAWGVDSICAQLASWHHRLAPGFRIVFNVSSLQFWQDNLLDWINQALARHGVSPHCVQLDIAMETLSEDPEQGIAICHRLKSAGLSLCLDRYAYSAANQGFIGRLPIDSLKVMISSSEDAMTYDRHRACVGLARRLGLTSALVGIEENWQLAMAESVSYDRAQGRLLGRELTGESFMTQFLPRAAN